MRSPVALLALAITACDGRRGPPPPVSEFLVAAGDSTFWIASSGEGIVVRGAPISLARFDGRLYELYVTDDDRSFYDAIMVGQRIYRRDLMTGDSLAVLNDTAVPNLADAYAARNPRAVPLQPHEEASNDPEVYATADLEVVSLHGPYLSFEHHADIGLPDGSEVHSVRRGVVDLRTSARRSVSDLFGSREAKRVIDEARRTFIAGLDSLRTSADADAQLLAEAMRDLRFDPTSFSIERVGNEPAVSFLVPGQGDWALELAVPTTPLLVSAPPWWNEVRETIPTSSDRRGEEVWDRPGVAVLARGDSTGDLVTLVLLDTAATEWRAARVPPPVHRIFWLDRPPIDSVSRRALSRAFQDAALYSEGTRIAVGPSPIVGEGVFRRVSMDHVRRGRRGRGLSARVTVARSLAPRGSPGRVWVPRSAARPGATP
jgi:hypothetical protein